VKSDALRERAGHVITTLAASDLWLPDQITSAVTSRLHTLSDGCRKVLTLAALLGERFSLQILSAVSGVGEDEVLDWLEEGIPSTSSSARATSFSLPIR